MVFRTFKGVEPKENMAEIFEIQLREKNAFESIVFIAIHFRTDTS